MNYLLAGIAGVLMPFSLAPYSLWWLGPLSMATLACVANRASPRQGAVYGWLFGSGSFASGVWWIYIAMHDFGNTAAPLAIVMTALFCAGIGSVPAAVIAIYCRWIRTSRAGQTLGFAAIWVLGEWFRGWFLTGFPWLYLGYAQLDTPLSGWAPVTGVFGLSFWVALSGAAIAYLITVRRRAGWAALLPVAACLALMLLGATLKQEEWTRPSALGQLRIGAVQPDIAQEKKWVYSEYWATLEKLDLSSEALWPDSDLVIWPEAAVPALYHHAGPFFDYIRERADSHHAALITGVPIREDEAMYNSVKVIAGGEGTYRKQRLVPFGEYVPLSHYIRGLIAFFDLPMSGFSRGAPDQPPLRVGDWSLAAAICYEIVYPDLVAHNARRSDALFTVSNDAWFGDSAGPSQHMQMAQMRALENGRELVRVTNSGITATVDHRGRIRQRLPSFQPDILRGVLHARSGQTPFNRWGSTPIVLLCFCLLLPAAGNSLRPRG